MYSADVISFARDNGLYDGTDADFSYSDVYCPLDAIGARVCEARVWAMFNFYKDMAPWLDYAQGRNLTNRMPWSIPIAENQRLSLNDTFWVTRTKFEGTWFDSSQDVGAGPFNVPVRWRPLIWTYNENTYINERTVAI